MSTTTLSTNTTIALTPLIHRTAMTTPTSASDGSLRAGATRTPPAAVLKTWAGGHHDTPYHPPANHNSRTHKWSGTVGCNDETPKRSGAGYKRSCNDEETPCFPPSSSVASSTCLLESRLKKMRLTSSYGDLCLQRDLAELLVTTNNNHSCLDQKEYRHLGFLLEQRQSRLLWWRVRVPNIYHSSSPMIIVELSIPRVYPHRPPAIRLWYDDPLEAPLPDHRHLVLPLVILCQERPDQRGTNVEDECHDEQTSNDTLTSEYDGTIDQDRHCAGTATWTLEWSPIRKLRQVLDDVWSLLLNDLAKHTGDTNNERVLWSGQSLSLSKYQHAPDTTAATKLLSTPSQTSSFCFPPDAVTRNFAHDRHDHRLVNVTSFSSQPVEEDGLDHDNDDLSTTSLTSIQRMMDCHQRVVDNNIANHFLDGLDDTDGFITTTDEVAAADKEVDLEKTFAPNRFHRGYPVVRSNSMVESDLAVSVTSNSTTEATATTPTMTNTSSAATKCTLLPWSDWSTLHNDFSDNCKYQHHCQTTSCSASPQYYKAVAVASLSNDMDVSFC